MKARSANDRFFFDLVADERLVRIVSEQLGEDVIHWGTDVLWRAPGVRHPWHCDIESCDPGGGFVSLWIGLRGTSRRSSLRIIPGSHHYGSTIQEHQHQRGFKRGQATEASVLEWARTIDSQARVVDVDVRNGDAIVFDGRLWHGTLNEQRFRTRIAILLQYARADRRVRMFDPNHLEWPLRTIDDPWPPVLAVKGVADPDLNRVVGAPRSP
jgi:ectoine hydroxylase-related dioxygenase (phytanoyl-CoA dioxygenase family)